MQGTLINTDILGAAVQLACRAPSLHNSQPWQWVAEGAGLHLYVDHSRILPSTDKSGREAYISCGAALDHLCVAMAAGRVDSQRRQISRPAIPRSSRVARFQPTGPRHRWPTPPGRRDPAPTHRSAPLRQTEELGVLRTSTAQRRRCWNSSPRRDTRRASPGTGEGVTTY